MGHPVHLPETSTLQVTQRLVKVEKTTKNHQQASLQLAALLKEIEKTVKATQLQAGSAGEAGGNGKSTTAANEMMRGILPTLEGIRKRLDAQAEERVLAAKDEKDIMLKVLGVVDEFRESGVTCKNLDTETKNLANDNTLLQIFNAFNELKNNVNQKETLNVKHCNEIKGEVARVTRGLSEVTKQVTRGDQQQGGSPGGNAVVTTAGPMFAAKVRCLAELLT